MAIILALFIFFRPFISSLAFPYLNLVYTAALCLFIAAWVLAKGLNHDFIARNKESLALLTLALIISLSFSKNSARTLTELLNYATFIPLLLISAGLDKKRQNTIITAILASCLVISFVAIYQYFIGFDRLLHYTAIEKINNPFVLDYLTRRRPFIPFVTPNALGGYLAMALPLFFTLKRPHLFIFIAGLALLLTQSLGALFASFLAIMLFLYLIKKAKGPALITIVICFALGAAILFLRMLSLKAHASPDYSLKMRLAYIRGALEIIKSHPLAGIGPGNFNLPDSRYAHNSFLQLWSEMGLFGLAALLWLIINIVRAALKGIAKSPEEKTACALLCACAAFLIHNLFDFTFFLPEVGVIWWAILGLLSSSVLQKDGQNLRS